MLKLCLVIFLILLTISIHPVSAQTGNSQSDYHLESFGNVGDQVDALQDFVSGISPSDITPKMGDLLDRLLDHLADLKDVIRPYPVETASAATDSGDPISWTEPDHGYHLIHDKKIWKEQYDSWDRPNHPNLPLLNKFDLNCDGIPERVDRIHYHTLTLFVDIDGNGIPTCGLEMGWFEGGVNAYFLLDIFDTDRNGFFDKNDEFWHLAKITDNAGNILVPERFGIYGFNYSFMIPVDDDCFGYGMYSDGHDGYVKDDAYHSCLESGGLDRVKKISDDHFRYVAYNPYGIMYDDGSWNTTFGLVYGYYD